MRLPELLGINKKIILASKSPRRKKLLENLGFELKIINSNYQEEKVENHNNYAHFVMYNAEQKALNVSKNVIEDSIIIAADTIVVLQNEILHKPKTEDEAYFILKKLSGQIHEVYTGVCLIDNFTKKILKDFRCTKVSFRELNDDEILHYISTGSPMDKAGAYGIQDDFGAIFVNKIEGCYYNIVGLPLELLYNMLKRLISEE